MWRRTLKDLTYKATTENTCRGFYFNEDHLHNKMSYNKFDLDDAFNSLTELRKIYNRYDDMRINKVNSLMQKGSVNVG